MTAPPVIRGGPPLTWPTAAAVAALAASAATGWAGAFPRWGPIVGLAVAGALPPLVLHATRRFGVAFRATAAGVAVVVFVTALAERSAPTPAALLDVAAGLRNGWAQLLDTRPPVPAEGGPMTTALAIVALGGGLAYAARRRRRPVLALVPPVVAFAAGLGFGAAGPPVPLWAPALLLAAAAAVLTEAGVATTAVPARASRLVRATAALGVVVTVVLLVGTSWPGAEARPRYDPRVLRAEPPTVPRGANPLAGLGAELTEPGAPERFRATVDGPVTGWRLVVLDDFDPATGWTASSTFRRAGAELTPVADPEVTTTVHQAVEPIDLAGPFLPAVAEPVAVDGVDGFVSDDNGTLARPVGAPVPARYQVTSAVPAYGPADIEAAVPAPPEKPFAAREDAQATLGSLLAQVRAASGASAAARLRGLAEVLAAPPFEAASPTAEAVPTGNGLFHVGRLLDEHFGTAEQYASAFAVAAELQGFDARVVVGYRPGLVGDEPGELVVRSADVHAWPEVRFERLGWVAFEPTPAATAGAPAEGPDDEIAGPVPVPSGGVTGTTTQPKPGGEGTDDDAAPDAPSETGADEGIGAAQIALLAAGAAVLLVLLACGGVVAAKAARRRRLQQGEPVERVAGAWTAAIDRLREAGVTLPSSLAAGEVASAPGVPATAAPALRGLAATAGAARFSRDPVAEATAFKAWNQADAVGVAVAGTGGRWAKVRRTLSPAPLLRRS